MKFSANLSMLFTELPFLSRFQAAADAGFDGVEFHFPYATAMEQVAAARERAGVEVVLFNLPPGDWSAGERGLACLPGRETEFAEGVALAAQYAEALLCPRVHIMAGIPTSPHARAEECYRKNLRYAAEYLEARAVLGLIEVINSRDVPHYHLSSLGHAERVLAALGSPNLKLLFDIYHVQVQHGDLLKNISRYIRSIGHFQFADSSGRHEPGTGEIDYESVFRHVRELGYRSWAGAEYTPSAGTQESLGWLRTLPAAR